MLKIAGNRVYCTAKDSPTIHFAIDNYKLDTGDTLKFTLRKNEGSKVLIQKEITSFDYGEADISLTSNDLNLAKGDYIYDIQLTMANGTVDTVISDKFTITLGVSA